MTWDWVLPATAFAAFALVWFFVLPRMGVRT
jgi:hypothetical protein